MNLVSIAGIIIGSLGIVFGIVLKCKNNKILKLEEENRNTTTNLIRQKNKTKKAEKEADIANTATGFAKAVSTVNNEVVKPNENEVSTELSENEKGIAYSVSSDPFDIG